MKSDMRRRQIYTVWWLSASMDEKHIDVGGQVCVRHQFWLIILLRKAFMTRFVLSFLFSSGLTKGRETFVVSYWSKKIINIQGSSSWLNRSSLKGWQWLSKCIDQEFSAHRAWIGEQHQRILMKINADSIASIVNERSDAIEGEVWS